MQVHRCVWVPLDWVEDAAACGCMQLHGVWLLQLALGPLTAGNREWRHSPGCFDLGALAAIDAVRQ